MGFLDEIGLAEVFKAIKIHLSKKVNSTDIAIELAKKIDKTSIGAKNGVAQLDASGTVPASQLPSYVDDVIEGYLNGDKFYKTQTVGTDKSVKYSDEIQGENGKIYIDKATDDNKTYRYTIAGYVPISDVPKATLKEIAQLKIDVEKLINITWSELKAIRDAGNLIPGLQYRITDYNCTTTQTDTQSAGHQFDIIVTADSTNKLNEVARAIQHKGDEYFSNCNLAAWKIWYCLDNDKKRFAWADATNGKGVIYRMIDEYGNDCPYDFKNIQFKRYKITAAKSSDLVGTYLGVNDDSDRGISIDKNDSKMFYTFSYLGKLEDSTSYSGEVLQDASIVGNTLSSDIESPYGVYNNSIKQFYDSNIASKETIQSLNNIVFLTLVEDVYYGCYSNSFGNDCSSNSFGNDCYSNSFGNDCSSNSFGNDCYYNSFGNDCSSNSFGNNCNSNSFGNNCNHNSFGNNCNSNSFGNNCNHNSFGNNCYSNSFGNGCYSNSFGNGCNHNSFGNGCNHNSFGNDCSSNSFGNNCNYNSFGNNCYFNSFGNNCYSNSFGNDCNHNSFGIDSSNNKLDAYYKYNKLDNGVQYVTFSGTGTNTNYVQNYHIKQGMTFTSSLKHTIIAKLGVGYELSVAKQTDGTVVEYCEADLLKSIQTSTITTSAKSNLD